MKKVLVCMLLCVSLLTVSAFLFTGCGEIVDIGGDYKEVKSEDITALVKDMELKTEGGYELKMKMDMTLSHDGQSGTTNTEANFIINYVSETDISMSGSMKVNASDGTKNESQNMTFYADRDYVYISADGKKVKQPLDSSSSIISNVTIPQTNAQALEMYNSMADKIELADEGSVKKIKYTMSEDNMYGYPVEMYIVIKDGNVDGIAVKGETSKDGLSVSIDLQMGKSSKSVNKPSDLDSYVEAA